MENAKIMLSFFSKYKVTLIYKMKEIEKKKKIESRIKFFVKGFCFLLFTTKKIVSQLKFVKRKFFVQFPNHLQRFVFTAENNNNRLKFKFYF